MATPHVSGVAGVLWQLYPSDTAAAIRFRLDAAVNDLGPAGRDTSFGFGRVNLCKAAGGGLLDKRPRFVLDRARGQCLAREGTLSGGKRCEG